MIEAYLRANKLFVDYNEVKVFLFPPYFLICNCLTIYLHHIFFEM